MHIAMGEQGVLTLPFGFPKPGRYRIWVQVKLSGKVMTGSFEVAVRPATAI